MTLKLQLEKKYESLYALKLEIQKLEDTFKSNTVTIAKLGREIRALKMSVIVNELKIQNRSLGQKIGILTKKMLDDINL